MSAAFRHVSFFHRLTGLLNGVHFLASDANIVALNTPPDHIAIDGHHDHLSKRVDVAAHARHLVLRNAFAVERITPAFQGLPLEERQRRQAEMNAAEAAILIDYQPPAPSADHEWNDTTKRWELSAAAQAKAEAQAAAMARITQLESAQHAIVRDMLLGGLAARPRLQAIHDEIAALQATL